MTRTIFVLFSLAAFSGHGLMAQPGAGGPSPLPPADLGYEALPAEAVDTSDPNYGVYERAEAGWRQSPLARKYGAALTDRFDVTIPGITRSTGELASALAGSETFEPSRGKNGPLLRQSLLAEIQAFVLTMDPGQKDQLNVTDRFQGVTRNAGEVISSLIFFGGSANQVVLRRMTEEPGPIESVRAPVHYATIEQAIEFREVTLLLEDIFAEARAEPFERVTRKLGDINLGWKNYLEHGYSQYPWETVINSHVTPRIFGRNSWYDPPRWQTVFAHPEAAFLLDTRSREDSTVEGALLIHGVGLIRYFGDDRSWFLGASGTASFSTNSDFGVGFGPSLHFGLTKLGERLPHITVSALWHDFEEGSDGPIVGVSVDLWRLVSKSGGEKLFREALR